MRPIIKVLLLSLGLSVSMQDARAAFALVAHAGAQSTDGNAVTTAGITTTGSTLIVVAVSSIGSKASPVVTDSNSNHWARLGANSLGLANNMTSFYYSIPSSVGASHTFTATLTSSFPSITVTTYSGSYAGLLDGSTGANSLTPGTITPSVNDCLLVTAASASRSGSAVTFSVTAGFTKTDENAGAAGVAYAGAMAYLIQTSAASANPVWTATNGLNGVAAMYVFTLNTATGAAQVAYPTVN